MLLHSQGGPTAVTSLLLVAQGRENHEFGVETHPKALTISISRKLPLVIKSHCVCGERGKYRATKVQMFNRLLIKEMFTTLEVLRCC